MRSARSASIQTFGLGTGVAAMLLMAAPARAIQWLHDLDAAKKRAKEQNKVLLVDFYADWCGPCRAMDAQVWNQPEIAGLAAKFVCVRVDYDRERTAAEWYEVKGIPAMLFLDGFDNKTLHVLGYRSAPDMRAIMMPFPESVVDLDEMFARSKQEPDNFVLKLKLADRYRQGGMYLLSNKLYAQAAKSKELRKDAALVEKVETLTAANLAHLDDPGRAIDALQDCLETYPSSRNRPAMLLGLVRAGLQLRDESLVKEGFEQLQKEYPDDPHTRSARELITGPP